MPQYVSHPSGRHVLAELVTTAAVLDDSDAIATALHDALEEAGASVRRVVVERFVPHGATVVALLAESHASVHTWPEHGTALVDVFTCGDTADPERAVHLLAARLGAEATLTTHPRGATPRAVVEPISAGLARRWDLGAVRWAGRTAYQRVLIADTAHGVTLFCDDERQSAEQTQLVYHEALYVPAALLARRRERVLVIGSSEGVVSGLAAAAGAQLVDHVDIDAECVRACAQHLPYGYTPAELAAGERGEGPVRVHYGDGWAFVHRGAGQQTYDVVVIDLPDERPDEPGSQHNRLYGTEFLRCCARLLRPGGVVVSQAGCATLWRQETLRECGRRFADVFATVAYHGSDEHEWSFLVGSPQPVAEPLETMVRALASYSPAPVTLDEQALRGGAVPPLSVRVRPVTDRHPPAAPASRGGRVSDPADR